MINPVEFSSLLLQAADADDNSTESAAPDPASAFFGVLMEHVALLAQSSPKQPATGPLSPQAPNASAGPPGTAGGTDGRAPMKKAFRFVLEHEGSGYVTADAGKESSRYGLLQTTAARYGYRGDVRSISRVDAEAIYRRMWEESGAPRLPAPLALIHFDTYMNSPQAAKKMLQSSGGSVGAYLRLRARRYARLSALKPERYARYMKGWMKRIEDLRVAAAQAGPSIRVSA
jgi:hypothetical protein